MYNRRMDTLHLRDRRNRPVYQQVVPYLTTTIARTVPTVTRSPIIVYATPRSACQTLTHAARLAWSEVHSAGREYLWFPAISHWPPFRSVPADSGAHACLALESSRACCHSARRSICIAEFSSVSFCIDRQNLWPWSRTDSLLRRDTKSAKASPTPFTSPYPPSTGALDYTVGCINSNYLLV